MDVRYVKKYKAKYKGVLFYRRSNHISCFNADERKVIDSRLRGRLDKKPGDARQGAKAYQILHKSPQFDGSNYQDP